MEFAPKDPEWFLAEIVQELTVSDDPRNVVWRNLTLLQASSPDDAYQKALRLGRWGDTKYLNQREKLVTIRFVGLSFLDVIPEPFEHGAEIMFQSNVGVDLKKLLPAKEKLQAFRPKTSLAGPDIDCGEIVRMEEERIKRIM